MPRPDRTERPLKLHSEVKAALVQLMATEHWLAHPNEDDAASLPPQDRSISLEAVEACEEAVEGWLTDEAIAILTSDSDELGDVRQFRLPLVGTHTEKAHELGLSRSLIVLGQDGHEWYCMPRRPQAEDRTRLTIFDDEDQSTRRVDLAGWLMQIVQDRLDDREVDEAVHAALESELNIARFTPRLIRTAETRVGPARRVRHTKFGSGTVLQELCDGTEPKLAIRFDDGSEKTLLARFVEDT